MYIKKYSKSQFYWPENSTIVLAMVVISEEVTWINSRKIYENLCLVLNINGETLKQF